LAETAKQNDQDWRLCPPAMKRNTTKQLCMCVAVYEFLTALLALDLALQNRNSETSMFDAVSI